MAHFGGGAIQSLVTFPNQTTFQSSIVDIAVSNTPVNLPSIPIPDGVDIILRAKISNGLNQVFISNSSANALLPGSRFRLRAGETISLALTNANLIWINGAAVGTGIEILVEA